MKKTTRLRAIVLSLAMALGMLLPAASHAQSDGFFRGSMESYENRDAGINSNDGTGITNSGIGENASLGSGLLILAAAGAGYAALRRKRNKKGFVMIIALAMIVTMSNCKKKVETINSVAENGVKITLTVDDGSKVNVDPTGGTTYATVDFEEGDVIYVGNNGHYCGYLQHNGTYFTGSINETNLSTSDYLHFYFMGNKGELSEPSIVSITDQTSKYPVISYAHSNELYNGAGSYSARLNNYCAIVKFTTTDIYPEITITGMNNTVSVDFGANNAADGTGIGHNPYAPSKTGEGDITLHKVSNTERWAILLPQGEVITATASAPNYVSESAFTVPEITANMYNSVGVIVSLSKLPYIDANFSVANGITVKFAAGNLQATYNGSSWSWQFAEHQWDYIGDGTSNTVINGSMTVSTNGTVDLFGWNGNSSSYDNYGIYNSASTSNYGNVASEALKHDWGHNPITNGGNTADKWRTLTKDEWVYVFNNNKRGPNRFLKASITANSTTYAGVILFPDNYDGSIGSYTYNNTSGYTTVSAQNWTDMENAGAVFLPAAGSRNGTKVNWAGSSGHYWSSTSSSNVNNAYGVGFSSTNFNPSNSYLARCDGRSVRLVFQESRICPCQ